MEIACATTDPHSDSFNRNPDMISPTGKAKRMEGTKNRRMVALE
jgi:hypothetical protein